MAKVKIKHKNPSPAVKAKLLECLSKNMIYATQIIDIKEGYIVLTRSDLDLDKIFQGECNDDLRKEYFNCVLPPELKAKRTVIIFNVPEHISLMNTHVTAVSFAL